MKSRLILLPIVGLVVAVACQAPSIPPSAPGISFVNFRNTASNVIVPATTNVVPANFIAEVSSNDRNRVTDVQCFNGTTAVTSGVAYRTACSYSGLSGSPELRAVATNSSGLTAQATKVVTVDSVPPVATALQVGGSDFDPNTGSSFNATVPVNTPALLRVASSGGDILQTFIERDGVRIAQSAAINTQVQVTPTETTPFNIVFGVVDTAGNVSRYSVLVAVTRTVGDGVPPVVSISSPVAGATVSGNLIVNVNVSDAGGIDKVTLIANNNPINTVSPQFGAPSVSFALDTLQFENGPLELKAVAVDKSGLSTTSSTVSTTVNNIQGPVLSIASPGNSATVSGIVPVAVNMRQRASAYDFATAAQCTTAGLPANCGQIKVDLIDYRGTIVQTQFVPTTNPGTTRLFETAGFDLSAIPNDIYTITASTQVIIATTTTLALLSDSVTVSNRTSSNQPPAVVIINPIRIDELQTVLPTFGQSFGYVVVDLSDNSGLDSVELRATCDSCAAGTGPVNALEQYQKLTGTATTVVLRFDADGTPFLPDGNYTLRVVAQDTDQNRNIQEVKINLNRSGVYTNPLNYLVTPGPATSEFIPGSGTCEVTNLDATKRYRAISWFVSPGGNLLFNDQSITNATSAGISSTFNAVGNWICFTQVTNITDARVDWVRGGFTVVKP
ncbi:MAG: Ig-like domain-containing protein [Deinococcales bacterium]